MLKNKVKKVFSFKGTVFGFTGFVLPSLIFKSDQAFMIGNDIFLIDDTLI